MNRDRGFALILAMVMISIAIILLYGLSSLQMHQMKSLRYEKAKLQQRLDRLGGGE